MNKKMIATVSVIVLLVGGYLCASPYIMLNNLKRAINENNSAGISRYIDFASVRENLKQQVSRYMNKQAIYSENEGTEGLGQMFALVMVDKITDIIVTPENLTLMMQGKKTSFNLVNQIHTKSNQINEPASHKVAENYSTKYLSMNQFEVTIETQEKYKQVKLILERDGLTWKIVKVYLPIGGN